MWTANRSVPISNAGYTTEDLVPPTRTVDVGEDATDLVAFVVHASTVASASQLLDPSNQERHRASAGPGDSASAFLAFEDPAAGTWQWNLAVVGSSTAPADCGDAPPNSLLCGGVFLRVATMTLTEQSLGP